MDLIQIAEIVAELLNASNLEPRRAMNEDELDRLRDAHSDGRVMFRDLTGKPFEYELANQPTE